MQKKCTMKYNFNVKDEIAPIVVKFNNGVTNLIEKIEKEIGFINRSIPGLPTNEKKTIYYDELTKMISKVTFVKGLQESCLGGFTLFPRVDNSIDIHYQDVTGRVLEEIKSVSVLTFVANLDGESIDDLKAFWENPTAKQMK